MTRERGGEGAGTGKPKSSARAKVIWGIKLGVSALICAFIFAKILRSGSLGQVGKIVAGIPPASFLAWMAGAFLVKGCGMFTAVLRWRLLLLGQGIRIGWGALIGSFLIGRFVGSFTPSTTGLDGWRLYDVARHSRNTAASVSVILVEKIIGFLVLSLLVLSTLPLGGSVVAGEAQRALFMRASWAVMAALGVPTAAALVLVMRPWLIRRIVEALSRRSARFSGKLARFADALAAYEKKKGLLLAALACGFGVHLGECVMYWFTGHALGFDVSLAAVLFVGPLMIGAVILPVSIAGVGVRELVWAVLLGGSLGGGDVGFASGAMMAFLGYAVGETISLAGGPIWLARRAGYRMIGKDEEAKG